MEMTVLCLFFLALLCRLDNAASFGSDEDLDLILTHSDSADNPASYSNKCTVRLHSSLEKLRRRQPHPRAAALIDLSGYALHQPLRHVPYDMYVTNIKVRTPGVGDWARVQKCEFSDRDHRMSTQILFNDLTVTGSVRLYSEDVVLNNPFSPPPAELCNMTLRLRRASMGINATPLRGRSKGIEVRTEARFMDPNYLSVHAYGCQPSQLLKKTEEDVRFEQVPQYNYTVPDEYYRTSRSEDSSEVRIVSLGYSTLPQHEREQVPDLHERSEEQLNEYHKDRILSFRPTEKDRLQAVLHIKNAIAQQANQAFQAHGPFAMHKPLFIPNGGRPQAKPISTITELDENLTPIRPVPHRPFEALFQNPHQDKIVSQPDASDAVSREMEDVFMKGIKTLLTKYLEKQLEMPLKEALLVNIGYTVSYG